MKVQSHSAQFRAPLAAAGLVLGCVACGPAGPSEGEPSPEEPEGLVSEAATAGNCPSVPGGWSYCTSDCPCDVGEGDCDSDSQCASGLVCHQDVGPVYGYSSSILDVCDVPGSPACFGAPVGDWDYCSSACPCAEGEGDCDRDADCQTGLTCGHNVGSNYGFQASVDVCEAPQADTLTLEFEDWFAPADGTTLTRSEEYQSQRVLDGVNFDMYMFSNVVPQDWMPGSPFSTDVICFGAGTVSFPRPVARLSYVVGSRYTTSETVANNTSFGTTAVFTTTYDSLQTIEIDSRTQPFDYLSFSTSTAPGTICIDAMEVEYAP